MTSLNDFIVENQALVVTLGLPSLAILIGLVGNFLVHRAKAMEVRLNGRMALAEIRRANLDELRGQLGKLNAIFMKQFLTSLSETTLVYDQHEAEKSALMAVDAAENVMFLIRVERDKREAFVKVVESCFDAFDKDFDPNSIDFENDPMDRLRAISHVILDAEWAQLEAELKRLK